RAHFKVAANPPASYPATLVTTQAGREIRFAKEQPFPEPLLTMRNFLGGDDKQLRGVVVKDSSGADALRFEPVRFVKLRDITTAAFDFAKQAITISLAM